MAAAQPDQEALVAQFCGITGAKPEEAQQYLFESSWNLQSAAALYFSNQEEHDEAAQPPPTSGPRTLGGDPVPADSAPPSSSTSNPHAAPKTGTQGKKIATLGDFKSGGHGHGNHPHGHGDDDDDDDYDNPDSDMEDPPENRDLFAGGEKSGLAVQDPSNPRDKVNKILEKARRNASRPGGEDPSPSHSHFSGAGQTLGSDDTPSQPIPTTTSPPSTSKPLVKRILKLWTNGFSVDDGPLYAFADPKNKALLDLIAQGRAPLEIMNVSRDQPVDVNLQKIDSEYVAPKRKYVPFAGEGQRLGNPTPGESVPEEAAQPSTTTATTTATPATASTPTGPTDLNTANPTLTLQIRLTNGTRLSARFNTTHTIGDVYDFVARALPINDSSRAWVLMTTFPSKDLVDKTLALGDIPEFHRGGVVVQKWS